MTDSYTGREYKATKVKVVGFHFRTNYIVPTPDESKAKEIVAGIIKGYDRIHEVVPFQGGKLNRFDVDLR